jgi:hypothetical protein
MAVDATSATTIDRSDDHQNTMPLLASKKPPLG